MGLGEGEGRSEAAAEMRLHPLVNMLETLPSFTPCTGDLWLASYISIHPLLLTVNLASTLDTR